jgi:hypothetical protein
MLKSAKPPHMSLKNDTRPNESEKQFLQLAYNRFYDLFEEVMSDPFWCEDEYHRFIIIRECFLIYSEILNYEPIKWVIELIKKVRPPMEGEIGKGYFNMVRNLLVHFPLFTNWNEIYFNRSIIKWCGVSRSIDGFLMKYEGHLPIKYRVWSFKKKEFTHVTISFPSGYSSDNKIYLSSMLPEKEGAIFSLSFMRRILDTQIIK